MNECHRGLKKKNLYQSVLNIFLYKGSQLAVFMYFFVVYIIYFTTIVSFVNN